MPDRLGEVVSLAEAEATLFREGRLLDRLNLDEWQSMFTDDGIYWIPVDESKAPGTSASLVYDDKLGREERVHHLLHLPFAAQNPRSRMVHLISNVEVVEHRDRISTVASNQVIYEVRGGDYTQVGLGKLSTIVASVEHQLLRINGVIKIRQKKILLIDRDMPQRNLTFII